jgi:predicted enzyme related to lactoylglutathione lyase
MINGRERRHTMDAASPRLFRILLEVSDIDSAVTFYSTLLGIQGREIFGGRHYFDCGDVILGFVDVSPASRQPRPTPQYLYFAVTDLEEVHGRAADLGCLSPEDVHTASGGQIAVRPWGERSFYATDPFGNLVCFVDAATVFTGR